MRHARPLAALSAALVLVAGAATLTVAGPASAVGVSDIRINEIESAPSGQGTDVRDWVELTNVGSSTVDVSGLRLRAKGSGEAPAAAFVLPSGSSIAPGAYLAFDVDTDVAGGVDLTDNDTVRLITSDESTVLDTYSWTRAATTTYGRCPNGTGPFTTTTAITKGAANPCGASTPTPTTPTTTVTVTPAPAPAPKDTTPPVGKVTGVKNNGFYPNKPPTPGCSSTDANGVVVKCDVTTLVKKVNARVIFWQAFIATANAAGLSDTATKNFTTPLQTGKG